MRPPASDDASLRFGQLNRVCFISVGGGRSWGELPPKPPGLRRVMALLDPKDFLILWGLNTAYNTFSRLASADW